jgi:hypothetical protein
VFFGVDVSPGHARAVEVTIAAIIETAGRSGEDSVTVCAEKAMCLLELQAG